MSPAETRGTVTSDPIKEQLAQRLIEAALDFFGHTGTEAFIITIPKTTPPVHIVAGEPKHIDLLLLGVNK